MWTTHWRYEPAVLYSGGWLWIEPKALIFFSMSLKPYYLRHISGSYASPVSSFFTFGTLLCFFMLYHVLKTWKKHILSSISMALEQALGFPTVVDTVIGGPETPSLKDLLTQLLAALSLDGLQLSASSGIASAAQSHWPKVMASSLGSPHSVTD